MDEKTYDRIVDECRRLVIARNKQYGNSVDIIDIHTIVGLCLMKLQRIYKMGVDNAKTRDELMDTLNYMVFALEKLDLHEVARK